MVDTHNFWKKISTYAIIRIERVRNFFRFRTLYLQVVNIMGIMENQSAMEHALSELDNIIKMVQEHKGSISQNITPDLLEDLERLEQAVTFFTNCNNEILEKAGVKPGSQQESSAESPALRTGEKQIVKRASEIERKAKIIQLAITHSMGDEKKAPKKPKRAPTGKKGEQKERRKLFKPLGGDKNWIPL